jgi:hypothetical protein
MGFSWQCKIVMRAALKPRVQPEFSPSSARVLAISRASMGEDASSSFEAPCFEDAAAAGPWTSRILGPYSWAVFLGGILGPYSGASMPKQVP